MQAKGISPVTRHSLAVLSKLEQLNQFYLAGGTACALHLGHRLSFDLAFFSKQNFNSKALENKIKKLGDWQRDQILKDTLLGTFIKTKASFFKYNYPLIDEIQLFEGVKTAGVKDLIAMKIDAIATRGVKRDFIDLYYMCRQIDITTSFFYYPQKYSQQDLNLLHAVRALTYFVDADQQIMPEMLVECDWQKVKAYFIRQVPKLLDQLLTRTI